MVKKIAGIALAPPVRCTGCGACMCVCPSDSIAMDADAEGFLYPVVNATHCTDCQNCVAVCPVFVPLLLSEYQSEPSVFAAWSLNAQTRYESTSGGIFTELALSVLRKKGSVAGARYTDSFLVEHTLIDDENKLSALRQSKYIQSEAKDIYKKIKTLLQNGIPVLFAGTPCQCAGLQRYLDTKYDKLILCDFICRGVNSPVVFRAYLDELEKHYGAKVKQVWFKNKTYGWNNFGTKIIFENGREYFGGRDEDPFLYGYIKKGLNLYMRPCCAKCEFKGISRPVDITLGDFWGVKLQKSTDSTSGGVSVVMIHSQKGAALFGELQARVYCEQHEIDEVFPSNACITESVKQGSARETFWREYVQTGFAQMIEAIKETRS